MSLLRDLPALLAVAALHAAFVLLVLPLADVLTLDSHDEGYNLIKALLLAHGHSFCSEIWSDQPPLLAYLLRGWAALFGSSILAARGLILTCAGLLLGLVYQIGRRHGGLLCGVLAALVLFGSNYYLRFSAAVLVGLPSMAFAVASLYLLYLWRETEHGGYAVASGTLLATALATKLFTLPFLVLAPVFLLAWHGTGAVWPLIYWVGGLAAAGGALLAGATCFSALPLVLDQLFTPHLATSVGRTYDLGENVFRLFKPVKDDAPVFLWALSGLVFRGDGWRAELRERGPFALWFLAMLAIHLLHQPAHYHHYLLVSVPLALLVPLTLRDLGLIPDGAGLREAPALLWDWRGSRKRRLLSLTLTLFLLLLPLKVYRVHQRCVEERFSARDARIVELIRAAEPFDYLVTDLQIYAYLTGHPVPPELAVTSYKRRAAGLLADADFRAAIETYAPPLVLLGEGNMAGAAERGWLRERYGEAEKVGEMRVYR